MCFPIQKKIHWVWKKRVKVWRDSISSNGKIAYCGTTLLLRTTSKFGGKKTQKSDPQHQRTGKMARVGRKGNKLK